MSKEEINSTREAVLHISAWRDILDYYKRRPEGEPEYGGVMLGYISDRTAYCVAFLFPPQLTQSGVYCEFSQGEIAKLRTAMQDASSEVKTKKRWNMVCWIHTHPGLGVFFSGTDVENWKKMTAWPAMKEWVAIVIDPYREEKIAYNSEVSGGAFTQIPLEVEDIKLDKDDKKWLILVQEKILEQYYPAPLLSAPYDSTEVHIYKELDKLREVLEEQSIEVNKPLMTHIQSTLNEITEKLGGIPRQEKEYSQVVGRVQTKLDTEMQVVEDEEIEELLIKEVIASKNASTGRFNYLNRKINETHTQMTNSILEFSRVMEEKLDINNRESTQSTKELSDNVQTELQENTKQIESLKQEIKDLKKLFSSEKMAELVSDLSSVLDLNKEAHQQFSALQKQVDGMTEIVIKQTTSITESTEKEVEKIQGFTNKNIQTLQTDIQVLFNRIEDISQNVEKIWEKRSEPTLFYSHKPKETHPELYEYLELKYRGKVPVEIKLTHEKMTLIFQNGEITNVIWNKASKMQIEKLSPSIAMKVNWGDFAILIPDSEINAKLIIQYLLEQVHGKNNVLKDIKIDIPANVITSSRKKDQ